MLFMIPQKTLIRFFFVLLFTVTVASCKTSDATKSRIEAEKNESAETKEIEKEFEEAIKNHEKMQSKETQKMMKKAKKRNKKLLKHKKTSWFKRVFDSD
jgi:septal ring factor EnvC (AmiA/AmiB activator)